MTGTRVALLGSTGFVGSAVLESLAGYEVKVVGSPRLTTRSTNVEELVDEARHAPELEDLIRALQGADVVINAAGDPDASSKQRDRLMGANALLPRVIAEAAAGAGVRRLIQISSAVVQNDRPVLDESEEMTPFSAYSESKVLGEKVLMFDPPASLSITRFRPPSVHAAGRRVTVKVSRIASSSLASVAAPGDQPTPQALLPNVAAAVAFLATSDVMPPRVVIHPWEGVTTGGLMRTLGRGRRPRRVPRSLAKAVVGGARFLGRGNSSIAANARRIELLWLGQRQAESWLTTQGWTPPVGLDGWNEIATSLRDRQEVADQ